jgi:hypothetical protein
MIHGRVNYTTQGFLGKAWKMGLSKDLFGLSSVIDTTDQFRIWNISANPKSNAKTLQEGKEVLRGLFDEETKCQKTRETIPKGIYYYCCNTAYSREATGALIFLISPI